MTKFPFGGTDLETHFYRYRKHSVETRRKMKLIVLVCPSLGRMRMKFIDLKYRKNPSFFTFFCLCLKKKENTCIELCTFLYCAFKAREGAMS